MALHGNVITCDRFGCRTVKTVVGDPDPEDVLTQCALLGWRFTRRDEIELHHCPLHFESV
jgi:hypothetical protein